MADWISAVEAAYDMSRNREAWLAGLVDACRPLLDRDQGLVGLVVSMRRGARILAACAGGDERLLELQRASFEQTPTAALSLLAVETVFSMSQRVFPFVPGSEELFRDSSGGRYRDAAGFVAVSGTGLFCTLHAPSVELHSPEASARRRWASAAAHVGAGLRPLLALEEASSAEARQEAVLGTGGELLDASGAARARSAREYLREAVRNRERARTRSERSDPEASLSLWQGLVAGRWSLVDRFERDGKRFIVAHRNDPEVGDPRGLTRRERQIAEYLGMGRSLKEISYLLGISASAVSNAIRRAASKLGLSGRGELASFFAPGGLRAQLAELEVAGEPLASGAAPLADRAQLSLLSGAERDVALDLLRGATIAAIAGRRDSSPNTVESQVKAIYAKLGVGSRVQLASKLARRV